MLEINFFYIIYLAIYCHGNFINVYFKVARHSFYYVDFARKFLAWKCEMYHESTCCISILFYTNKHDKIKKNSVVLENISFFFLCLKAFSEKNSAFKVL